MFIMYDEMWKNFPKFSEISFIYFAYSTWSKNGESKAWNETWMIKQNE